MCRQLAKNIAHHNTIHRLQAKKGDGNPLQQPKPQTRQAAKGKTNQEKNRHPPPTHTILHQDGQPNIYKILSRRISFT